MARIFPREVTGNLRKKLIVYVSLLVLALVSIQLFSRVISTGILAHDVTSDYQAGPTQIRVLLPDKLDPDYRYPVIYVLPVDAYTNELPQYGDALREIQKANHQNKKQAIFVMPTFSETPWYADHPSDASIQQESYVLNFVVPFIDRTYPTVPAPHGRHLLGFSKSGWGSWSLLLRHPDIFGRALAWDAPMMMETVGIWDTSRIFGSQEQFDAYKLSHSVKAHGPELGNEIRLFMTGCDEFCDHMRRMNNLLTSLAIPHTYHEGTRRKHDWRSGWLNEAVDTLVSSPQ